MARDGRKSEISQPSSQRRAFRRRIVRVKELDRPVRTARKQLLVLRPTHALDNIRMCLTLPYLLLTGQIPNLHNTITTSTREPLQRLGVFSNCVDTIHMSSSQISNEGLREHALQLRSVQRARVLSRPLERMQSGIEVARRAGDIAAGRLGGGCGAGERLDFLKKLLVSATSPSYATQGETYHGER